MNIFIPGLKKEKIKDHLPEHQLVALYEPTHNITEGSEFLDDAIRTRNQPLMNNEEGPAAGSPEDLL